VPGNTASVRVGMAGSPIYMKSALPNMNYYFTPRPQYWVVFGSAVKGETVNFSSITKSEAVIFPSNIYEVNVILNDDDTWTIEQTK
jgi:hypothetical protein